MFIYVTIFLAFFTLRVVFSAAFQKNRGMNMAIITISRQHFSTGHEICKKIAEKSGYKLYDRTAVFQKMLELGCSEEKVKAFDEIKPGLLPSLSKYNDEYLYYLKTAVLSIAAEDNCVIEGRGAYIILKDLPNMVSARIFELRKDRVKIAMAEENVDEKKAMKLVKKADNEQFGFIKYYFKKNILYPVEFNLIVNAGNSDSASIAEAVIAFTKSYINEDKEKVGKEKLSELLIGQQIVNLLRFIYSVDIDSMRAEVDGKTVRLYGVASTKGIVDYAVKVINCELPEYKVVSNVQVVQAGMNLR